MRKKAEKSNNKNNSNNDVQRYELTDEDLDQVSGGRDVLLGTVLGQVCQFSSSTDDDGK